jgi:zinc transport system ATP-binding protein
MSAGSLGNGVVSLSEISRTSHQPGMVHPWHQLHLENVSVWRGSRLVIDHVTFSLTCGDIVAVIGPNGGGKSTLLRTILGEWRFQGKITFTDSQGRNLPRPHIGYMPQQLLFDRQAPLTVADLLCARSSRWPVFVGHRTRTLRQTASLLAQVEADHLLNRRLGELSGGELQRVTLAFALDPMPDILLLDEPVSALDETGQRLFYQLVSNLREQFDFLTLIVSHDLDVLPAFASTLIVLNHQVLAAGPTQAVLAARAGGEA